MFPEKLQQICDLASVPTCVIDRNGAIVYANKLVEDVFKVQCSKLIHTHVFKNPLRDGYHQIEDSHLTTKSLALDSLMYRMPAQTTCSYDGSLSILESAYPYYDFASGEVYIFVQHAPITPFQKIVFENIQQAKNANIDYGTEGEEGFPSSIVATSEKMRNVLRAIKRAAQSESTIMLLGETGVGKEVIARAAHSVSRRKDAAFMPINCGAIPADLLESELFGYEKGAFTSAVTSKLGIFELAQGGTVFLDEIGELPLLLQVKLLRVLQEGECMRIGGKKPYKLDIRIIAATNRNLKEMMENGKFRSDLYYRLNVIQLMIPPLRERPEDIVPLATSFLNNFNRQNNTSKKLSRKLCNVFEKYKWPGNIRELKNCIERLVVMSKNEMLVPDDLSQDMIDNDRGCRGHETSSLEKQVDEFEYRIISEAISRCGSIRKAGRELQCNHATLLRKLKKHAECQSTPDAGFVAG